MKRGKDTFFSTLCGAEKPKLSLEHWSVLLANIYKGDQRCVAYVHGGSAWEDAEPLVATLISERLERQQALDTELRLLNLCSEDRREGFRLELLLEETEWLGKDHPYVVSGMGSLHDAVVSFECADLKEKRRRALSHGLESRGLVVEVTVLDDRCAAFIEGNLNTTAEEISATLLEERRSRLHALQTALGVLGYPDVGMSSVFYQDEWRGEHFQSFKRIKPLKFGIYPEREAAKKRFQFIEKGKGSADSVAATISEYHRAPELVRVLQKRGCPAWVGSESFPDALLQWVGEKESCRNFVKGRLAGVNVDDFVQGLVSEEQADPHGEAWKEPLDDYDDDGGGNEWKYDDHSVDLSGGYRGDYGNDPYQDAKKKMWDSYWDY